MPKPGRGITVYRKKEEEKKKVKKHLKAIIISLICSIILLVAIPNEQTAYTMFVTSQITPQNIETVGDGAKGVIDYIFEKIDELEE